MHGVLQAAKRLALRRRSRSAPLGGTLAAFRTQQACFLRQHGRTGVTYSPRLLKKYHFNSGALGRSLGEGQGLR